jgi:hypothetical protein
LLSPGTRFRVCHERVVARVLDGEAVIIDLSSGVYYSIQHTGAVVWELIGASHSLEEVEAAVIDGHDVSPEQARADVRRLAGELLDEGLIVPLDAQAAGPPPALPRRAEVRLPYMPPTLDVFRDVSDLLAIDPPMPTLPDGPWKESGDG